MSEFQELYVMFSDMVRLIFIPYICDTEGIVNNLLIATNIYPLQHVYGIGNDQNRYSKPRSCTGCVEKNFTLLLSIYLVAV